MGWLPVLVEVRSCARAALPRSLFHGCILFLGEVRRSISNGARSSQEGSTNSDPDIDHYIYQWSKLLRSPVLLSDLELQHLG